MPTAPGIQGKNICTFHVSREQLTQLKAALHILRHWRAARLQSTVLVQRIQHSGKEEQYSAEKSCFQHYHNFNRKSELLMNECIKI